MINSRQQSEQKSVEAHGIIYAHYDNFSPRSLAEDDADNNEFFAVNRLTVQHVLAEAGLVISSENHGLAENIYGDEQPADYSMALKRNPEAGDIGVRGLMGRVNALLGAKHSEITDATLYVSDSLIDIRDARLALELALREPEFEDAAEVVRKRREQLFGN